MSRNRVPPGHAFAILSSSTTRYVAHVERVVWVQVYKENILPALMTQIVGCKDAIAQEYL